jgi:NADH-quinone oxidoreductase subunit M
MNDWLTTILIFLPVAGALFIWLTPLNRFWAGSVATLVSLVEVGFWILAVHRFDFGKPTLQFQQQRTWIPDLGVSYHVGQFAFSLWLVGLATIVGAATIAYAWWVGRERARAYFGLMLFLTGAVVGVFSAQDLLVFYAFFEAMLIPLYVLIGVWGGAGRLGATLKFVIYTVAGSLLMLAAIIVYGLQQGTFDLTKMSTSTNDWLFLGFAIAFAVKAPLFPFHGWLPDAYREAPAEVSAVLSGVVSKAAAYGFLRIAITKFPEPAAHFRVPILILATIGLVYGSLLAFRAPDVRGVVAYSSLAQMGLITLGIFAVNDLGLDGAVLQMVNHGLISAALFLLAGMIERRAATGDLALLGGFARGRPVLATILMTTGVIALAVPLSTAFAGEFLILAGLFQHFWVYAVIGAGAIVLAAMYMLRLISAVLHERVGPAVSDAALDLRGGELAVVVPLVALLLGLSAWPNAITGHAFGVASAKAAVKSALLERPGGSNELAAAAVAYWQPGTGSDACGTIGSKFLNTHADVTSGTFVFPCGDGRRIRLQIRGAGDGQRSVIFSWSER